ncbi:MAG: hypothetical protein NVS2B16_29250 [Chloroflexota bacterium]
MKIHASYILPIRHETIDAAGDLTAYLQVLSGHLEIIVVDGSPKPVFDYHARDWISFALHLPVDPDLVTPNGKVGGVLTGVRRARHERLVLADDDVRYTIPTLARLVDMLADADVVRPQNYFYPRPWHARWDTARTLLNRAIGGDWPGTVGVRRSILQRSGGYDGNVMFENLELVRTVRACGGREVVARNLFVRRLPPSVAQFRSQRVRQAYDEFARPLRLFFFLSLVPVVTRLVLDRRRHALSVAAALVIATAEAGRRRAGGTGYFPATCSLLAPAWLMERALCSWLALYRKIHLGGIGYRGTVIRSAATPLWILRRRHTRAVGHTPVPGAPALHDDNAALATRT